MNLIIFIDAWDELIFNLLEVSDIINGLRLKVFI
jgi:hypothetical protein